MSGKSQTLEDGSALNESDDITIPSVMLSSSDASSLMDLARQLVTDGRKREKADGSFRVLLPIIRMRLSSVPSVFDTEAMGSPEFPKLTVRPNIISIAGHGDWAAMLISMTGSGKDWQLYRKKRHYKTMNTCYAIIFVVIKTFEICFS